MSVPPSANPMDIKGETRNFSLRRICLSPKKPKLPPYNMPAPKWIAQPSFMLFGFSSCETRKSGEKIKRRMNRFTIFFLVKLNQVEFFCTDDCHVTLQGFGDDSSK